MAVIRLGGFFGENRATTPMQLGEGVGTVSRNQKPGRGDLRPWKSPTTVATVPASRNTIYRMGRDVATPATYWLSWTGTVHAVRTFDGDDTTERTVYTGDGAPKVTDNITLDGTDPQDNPTAYRPLGIPAPAAALTVATDSGSWIGLSESFYYVYTYVNDWGWESAPSPVSAVNTRPADATATLSAFSAAPGGNYNITLKRIYRTQTGASGATEFFFLREIAIGTASTVDDNRTLGDVLPTTAWIPAPGVPQGGAANFTEGNLSFLTALWNGMMAGISGNGLRFCEPYSPYAWPIGYEILPPDSKPVGIGVIGQQILVLTTGRPLLVAGSSPDSMDEMPVEMPQACVAPKSIVSMGSGVAWASEDGLCWYGAGGPRLLTEGMMLREDWRALVPSSVTGRLFEGLYFGSYDDGGGRKGFLIDPSNPHGMYFLDTGYPVTHYDELQDQLYVLSGQNVQKWDAGSAMSYTFKSKTFRMPKEINFACAEVVASAYPVTLKVDAMSMAAEEVAAMVAKFPGICSAPVSTTLRTTLTVNGRGVFKLPAGFVALDWALQLEGSNAVQGAAIATSVQELAQT